VSLVLDLRLIHERFESSSDLSINGHLHNPDDVDGSLNETVGNKILQYRSEYNNRPSLIGKLTASFQPLPPHDVLLTSQVEGR
jgi:hypothetical protein